MRAVNYYLLIYLFIFIYACSKKPEPKLELFSPQAFAFDLGEGYEINASLNAKGFRQDVVEDSFLFLLHYRADIITPERDTITVTSRLLEEKSESAFSDIPIQFQIEIDSSFSLGNYKLIVYVTDSLSQQSKSVEIPFDIEK